MAHPLRSLPAVFFAHAAGPTGSVAHSPRGGYDDRSTTSGAGAQRTGARAGRRRGACRRLRGGGRRHAARPGPTFRENGLPNAPPDGCSACAQSPTTWRSRPRRSTSRLGDRTGGGGCTRMGQRHPGRPSQGNRTPWLGDSTGATTWQFQLFLAAERAATICKGVKSPANSIAIERQVNVSDLQARIEAAFRHAAEADAHGIRIEAREDGTVVLSGTVRTRPASARRPNVQRWRRRESIASTIVWLSRRSPTDKEEGLDERSNTRTCRRHRADRAGHRRRPGAQVWMLREGRFACRSRDRRETASLTTASLDGRTPRQHHRARLRGPIRGLVCRRHPFDHAPRRHGRRVDDRRRRKDLRRARGADELAGSQAGGLAARRAGGDRRRSVGPRHGRHHSRA